MFVTLQLAGKFFPLCKLLQYFLSLYVQYAFCYTFYELCTVTEMSKLQQAMIQYHDEQSGCPGSGLAVNPLPVWYAKLGKTCCSPFSVLDAQRWD